ncbi:uncharacterized protein [Epargyreus clarus]|uniref:uncharacterized protein n=1 Tax=Epargyreus clarus TaxID=520877 RepID=UPI003C30D32B
MTRLLPIFLAIFAIINTGHSVSTKLDFEEEKEESSSVSNSSKDDEDVEVKHTIVVSTKVRNNNRRGLHNNDGDNGALTYSIGYGPNSKKDDSDEVPVIKGYKSVESTVIRTPDTRDRPPIFTDSVFINRNIRDGYDTYPIASNPTQWQPSSFFNNVNWWKDESVAGLDDFGRRNDWIGNRNQGNFHRKITNDGVKEFYCRKCRELSNGSGTRGCVQQRSNWFYESTTPKVKIDGKLAKFN